MKGRRQVPRTKLLVSPLLAPLAASPQDPLPRVDPRERESATTDQILLEEVMNQEPDVTLSPLSDSPPQQPTSPTALDYSEGKETEEAATPSPKRRAVSSSATSQSTEDELSPRKRPRSTQDPLQVLQARMDRLHLRVGSAYRKIHHPDGSIETRHVTIMKPAEQFLDAVEEGCWSLRPADLLMDLHSEGKGRDTNNSGKGGQ